MSEQPSWSSLQDAHDLAAHFAAFPQVSAVALGGSHSSGAADAESDIDLYVYTTVALPVATHAR